MAAKKKTRKNSKKTKQRSAKKSTPNKKKLQKKKSARKSATKKPALKKASTEPKSAQKKRTAKKKTPVAKKKALRGRSSASTAQFVRETRSARSGEQSGDLQGVSRRESADSESVDELLEEGNAFEAEVVQGVEDAGDDAEQEVRTHEVPEDDVPEEYLDKD